MLQRVPCFTKPEAYGKRYEITDLIETKTQGSHNLNDLRVVRRGDMIWSKELMKKGVYVDYLDERLIDEMAAHREDKDFLNKKCEVILVEGKAARQVLDEIKGPTTAPEYEGTDTIRGLAGLPDKYDKEVTIDEETYTLSLNGFHSP